jgi:hypothetical protein
VGPVDAQRSAVGHRLEGNSICWDDQVWDAWLGAVEVIVGNTEIEMHRSAELAVLAGLIWCRDKEPLSAVIQKRRAAECCDPERTSCKGRIAVGSRGVKSRVIWQAFRAGRQEHVCVGLCTHCPSWLHTRVAMLGHQGGAGQAMLSPRQASEGVSSSYVARLTLSPKRVHMLPRRVTRSHRRQQLRHPMAAGESSGGMKDSMMHWSCWQHSCGSGVLGISREA